VVIPATLRRKYNLEPGANLHGVDYGGVLALIPASRNPIDEAAGILKGDTPITQALLSPVILDSGQ
jgi:hypothetical protein